MIAKTLIAQSKAKQKTSSTIECKTVPRERGRERVRVGERDIYIYKKWCKERTKRIEDKPSFVTFSWRNIFGSLK